MGAPDHPLGPLAPLATRGRRFVIAERSSKVPLQPSGVPASSTDAATWCTYEEAAYGFGASVADCYGVGFVLTGDGLGVIDIDDALQPDGKWHPLAIELCRSMPGAVVEVSQSGRGLHAWFRLTGSIPEHAKKATVNGLRIECYSADRYVLLGSGADGHLADDCPGAREIMARYFPSRAAPIDTPDTGPRADWRGPADDDELIRRALRSRSQAGVFGGNRASFADLWEANAAVLSAAYPHDSKPYDASDADMALAQHLAFWTGCDRQRIERLMRRSALAREKWDTNGNYLVGHTITNACAKQGDVYREREPATTVTTPAVNTVAASGLTFSGAAGGWIDARLETVADTLQSPESGIRIAMDRFLEQPVIGRLDGTVQPLKDVDYGKLRAEFQRRGFKAIAAEIMRTAVAIVADQNAFDSAHDYVQRLQWDGLPRIDTAMPTYFRSADTPYTRAVGAYLFTALAGRALKPGVQVDMVPVLVGLQGERKSSAVRALAPHGDFFTEVNLSKIDDDNTARLIRGKLVGELAELRGLRGRDVESIKAWITRRDERWRSLWNEFMTTYPRRIVFVGTTNDREFLDDPSGERRWLPITAGLADVEKLERDREQLWAEGAARFKASGVAWQDAERLARAEHEAFKLADPWRESVEEWLSQPAVHDGPQRGSIPFKRGEVALGALHRHDTSLTPADDKRLAKVLRSLGYETKSVRVGGDSARRWVRVG